MNNSLKQTSWLILGAAFSIFSFNGILLADDTELFIAGEDPDAEGGVQPNIMFIIDTSGSMDNPVTTQERYDDNNRYDNGSCNPDYIYVTSTNNEPDCSSDSTPRFNKTFNNCFKSANSLSTGAFYSDEMLAWRPDIKKWLPLPSSGEFERIVDCEFDQRDKRRKTPDGEALNDDKYARDGNNGPYSSRKRNLPSFSNDNYLWSGNALNWAESAVAPRNRLEVVQDVVTSLLTSLEDVNVGLMRFNFSQGGPVLFDIRDLDEGENRAEIIKAVEDLRPGGWTPLSETFYEFGQYMYGEKVDYGDDYEYRSTANSRVGNALSSEDYETPTEFLCQKNYVVYLTDGEPTNDQGANAKAKELIGYECANTHGNENGKCLDELADYYANTPVISIGGVDGQPINTYTIGFAINLPILQTTAEKGNGSYFQANDAASLTASLTKIATEILDDSTTFTAPAVPVNSFNRTENLSTVYTSLFQPSSSEHWPGNLKRYDFVGGEFVDFNGDPAVNPDTGFFKTSAQSYWSASVDGDQVIKGGAASQLPSYSDRELYTDIAGNTLTASDNRIEDNNDLLTAATFGAGAGNIIINPTSGLSMDAKTALIEWLNGRDLRNMTDIDGTTVDADFDDTRRQLGDPLHARPVPVVYGTSEDDPQIVVYLVTNDGFLHAIDTETGEELWAYSPASVLSRMYGLYNDEVSATKGYILDGQPALHILNDDGLPGLQGDGEEAILVMGMRRGGSNYFALNITNKTLPKKLWEINNEPGDFAGLGQTWSEPQFGKVNIDGEVEDVAIFSGGYDNVQDTIGPYTTDTVGNAIYMVDIESGALLWSAGNGDPHDLKLAKMVNSIPAPPLVIDTNRDGLLDRLYTGDMGGRLWRIDFTNGNSRSSLAQGGALAELGAAGAITPTAADMRRFYSQVDLVEDFQGETRYFALNIGSGYRAHPLNRNIADEFYSIRDFKPYASVTNNDDMFTSPVVRADLIDITTKPITPVAPYSAGWRLSMNAPNGEKILGKSLTINGIVYFTSFAPGGDANTCIARAGTNRLYKVGLLWGTPVVNLDALDPGDDYPTNDDGELDKNPFSKNLNTGGIASEVYLMSDSTLVDGKKKTVFRPCSSLVCGEDEIVLPPNRTYWTEEGL